MKLLGIAAIVLALVVSAQDQNPFRMPRIPIADGGRWDANPRWVGVPWKASEDAPFRAIRQETAKATEDPLTRDKNGVWARKATRAYEDWYGDHQDPVKLYRASSYLSAAQWLDHDFNSSQEFARMSETLNLGWSALEKPPHSYEFVRRGYLVNCSDLHFHKFGDLQFRLLDRDPADRSVIIAMAREYTWRKPVDKFEQRLFRSLEAIRKTPQWRPWDDYFYALALRAYGQKHQKRSSYDSALLIAEGALKQTPKGWDAKWLEKWIAECRAEREEPNFGSLPNGRYVDDIDPP